MSYLIRTRRHVVAALTLTAILFLSPAVHSRAATSDEVNGVPPKICAFDWRRGPWHVKQLIACAARHWGVPGGVATALAVASRESHFDPRAYNPSGCAGIYQHMLRYWPGRARQFGFTGWSAFNARANIIVTMKMVHGGGWGPWA
jgi:transglycosylase-like protein with SLT domain